MRRLKLGSETAEKILKRYPDYAKAPPEYLAAITEALAFFDYRIQAQLADIMTGISARCKYLPSVADIVELAREFAPPVNGHYKLFEDEPSSPGPYVGRERMQQLVDELHQTWDPPDQSFKPIPLDQLKSSVDLKTPSRPASKELRQLLMKDDWPSLQAEEAA